MRYQVSFVGDIGVGKVFRFSNHLASLGYPGKMGDVSGNGYVYECSEAISSEVIETIKNLPYVDDFSPCE
jgi:hypothetical protein